MTNRKLTDRVENIRDRIGRGDSGMTNSKLERLYVTDKGEGMRASETAKGMGRDQNRQKRKRELGCDKQ